MGLMQWERTETTYANYFQEHLVTELRTTHALLTIY